MTKKRVLIMGAAGRDFHNFNVYFRDNPDYKVMAFTATQIPNIEGRVYPAELAGEDYPKGVPIYPESELVTLIQDLKIDQVVFAYSDVSHNYIMHKASQVLAAGVKISGCTVHFVSPEMDAGPIIIQAAVPVLAGDDEDSLAARVLTAEHQCYPRAVRLIAENRATVEDGRVTVDDAANAAASLFNPPAD